MRDLEEALSRMKVAELKRLASDLDVRYQPRLNPKKADLVSSLLSSGKVPLDSVTEWLPSESGIGSSVSEESSSLTGREPPSSPGKRPRRSQISSQSSAESPDSSRTRSSSRRRRSQRMSTKSTPASPTRPRKNIKKSFSSNGTIPTSQPVHLSNGHAVHSVEASDDHHTLDFPDSDMVLWKHPFYTVFYFSQEVLVQSRNMCIRIWQHRLAALAVSLLCFLVFVSSHFQGPHQKVLQLAKWHTVWSGYWVLLGVLSSVGLGSGLHTFLLYLGPHIASVTLAAFECMSTDFPSPPYPDDIVCPAESPSSPRLPAMSIWAIMSKVRWESFLWGLGTALGELPPYFMARAARRSNQHLLDSELAEVARLSHAAREGPAIAASGSQQMSLSLRSKLFVEQLIERVGFVGILLMASIPNPLFDLAGLTCGYLLVPFWVFFGATVIGKAIVKMHIQKLFVIVSFSENHAEHLVEMIGKIPTVGPRLQQPFQEYFRSQKEKLHLAKGASHFPQQSWISWAFEKLVLALILCFLVSFVNSVAQSRYKHLKSTATRGAGAAGTSHSDGDARAAEEEGKKCR